MGEVKELSEKAKDVMEAILTNPNSNAANIAEFLGVSVATVTGSLGTLKKRGYVTVEEGILTPTDDANFEFGAGTTAVTTPAPTADATETKAVVEAAATTDVAEEVIAVTEAVLVEDAAERTPELAAAEANAEHQVEVAAELHAEAVHATEVAAEAVTEVVAIATSKNKAEKARAVFEELKDAPRKDLMARLMSDEVGLSKNGANTYIYNMRKSAGMVKPRAAVVTEATTAETPAPEAAETPAEEIVADASTPAVVAEEAAIEEKAGE